MSNLKQTQNKVRIEGILAESNIEYRSYKNKNGNTVKAIGGEFQVLVRTAVNGVPTDLMIPVRVFSNEITKAGEKNPSFTSIEKVMNEFVSIAAGGEEKATKVRITNGSISVNEYYDGSGRLVSYPRVTTSFVSEVTGNFNPEATFDLVMVVDSMKEVVDSDGVPVEPEKFMINGSIVQYGGNVDCISLVANSPATITGVRDYWNVGDTVRATGILNFSFSTVEINEANVAFGQATKKQTRKTSELIITSGYPRYEGDLKINEDELKVGKAERLARLAELKAKGDKTKATPAPATSYDTTDLGF